MSSPSQWKNSYGEVVNFTDMDDRYLINTAAYIFRTTVERMLSEEQELQLYAKLEFIYRLVSGPRRINRFSGLSFDAWLTELSQILQEQDERRALRTGGVQISTHYSSSRKVAATPRKPGKPVVEAPVIRFRKLII